MQRKQFRRTPGGKKKTALRLRIAKGLDALRDVPEGSFNMNEKTVLSRIMDIHTGVVAGRLTRVDYLNLKRIAKRFGIRI